jgi:hypothetical protein
MQNRMPAVQRRHPVQAGSGNDLKGRSHEESP